MKILVFDTETTGLSKEKTVTKDNYHLWPSIVQLSYLIYDTQIETITLVYDTIVKVDSSVKISPESTKIHKITKEISEMDGCDIESAIFMLFQSLLHVDRIVGHNITFDINMIKAELYRIIGKYDKEEDNYKIYSECLQKLEKITNIECTMKSNIERCNIKRINKMGEYLKYPTLEELHIELFQSKPKYLHNSLNDILVTLRCFIMITNKMDICKFDNIKTFYKRIC